MNKRRILFLVCALATGLWALRAGEREQVAAVAKEALPQFLHRMPVGQERAYGFADRQSFARAEVGIPYRMAAFPPGVDAASEPRPQNEWRVPIRVDGQSVALLTVVSTPTGLRAVDFGATGLARELARVEASQPPGHDNPNRFILRLYRDGADFLVVTASERPTSDAPALPLFEAAAAMNMKSAQAWQVRDVARCLAGKEAARAALGR